MKMKLGFLVLFFMQLLSLTEAPTWTVQPTSATRIQGQSVSITWTADLGNGETWTNVRVSQEVAGVVNKQPMIRYSKTSGILVYTAYISRSADLNLTASLSGTLLTTVFTMKNLNRSTDEHLYLLRINFNDNLGDPDNRDSTDFSLKVLVPPAITSPASSPTAVSVNKTQTAQLVCTATGYPTPSINWTRDGVIVGTGSPFTTPAVTLNDDKTCYTCVAYNGVLEAKTANVCLNVQCKPRNATIESDRSTVCQNDKVSLTCTSGPANPAPSSYEFYNNGVLIGTSTSNVYEATATAGLPDVNKFVCVPRNLLGVPLENAIVIVSAKVPPVIVTSPQATTTLVEGNVLSLFCNASGVPAPNITWMKVGGSNVGSTETFTISSITRGQEGTYRCTASNGDECSNVTAEANVVVNSAPNISNIIVSEDSLTVTWSNLLLPHNKIATCLIHVMESFNGISRTAASNTSHGSSISCSVSGLQPSTLYRIKYYLQVNENHVNGTIYIGTSAKGVSPNHSTFPSTGVPTNVFSAVTAVAVVVIVVLILVVIRMRLQVAEIQNDKRFSSKGEKKSSLSNPPSLKTAYENKDFALRETKPVEDMSLYEQVQNRDQLMNQDGSSFPMDNLQGRPGRLAGKCGSTTADNQFPSKYEDPSYQSLDQSQMEATKRDNGNQGSYGHLVDFARRPDLDNPKTLISPQDQDHYQEMQPVNPSKYYQSLQNMQRPAFNV